MSKHEDLNGAKLPVPSRRQILTGATIPAFALATLDEMAGQSPSVPEKSEIVFGPATSLLLLTVNGEELSVRANPATTLVEVLRGHLDLTGTKVGCDRGACSACTVWLDGEVVASCMTFAFDAREKKVTTIEGLAENGKLHPVQQAFIDHDALQCGFCTPGMLMSCAALCKRNPNPTLHDVKKAVSGHLCRCGTYNNIFKAVLSTAGGASAERSNGGAQ